MSIQKSIQIQNVAEVDTNVDTDVDTYNYLAKLGTVILLTDLDWLTLWSPLQYFNPLTLTG